MYDLDWIGQLLLLPVSYEMVDFTLGRVKHVQKKLWFVENGTQFIVCICWLVKIGLFVQAVIFAWSFLNPTNWRKYKYSKEQRRIQRRVRKRYIICVFNGMKHSIHLSGSNNWGAFSLIIRQLYDEKKRCLKREQYIIAR